MKSRKGQDFLNVVEIIVFALCIFVAFMFLSMAKQNVEDQRNQDVEAFQYDHKTIQSLRTLAQTPVTVENTNMSFSQAANTYMETLDYYTLFQSSLSSTQRNELQRKLSIYQQVLQETTQTTIVPLFVNQQNTKTNIILSYWVLDERDNQRDLRLGGFGTGRKDSAQQAVATTLQLPAYFTHANQLPGSYYLELSIEVEKDNSLLPGFIQ